MTRSKAKPRNKVQGLPDKPPPLATNGMGYQPAPQRSHPNRMPPTHPGRRNSPLPPRTYGPPSSSRSNQGNEPYRFGESYRPSQDAPPRNGDGVKSRYGSHKDSQEHGPVSFTFRSNVQTSQFPPMRPRNGPDYRNRDRRNNDGPRRGFRRSQTHNRPIMRALRDRDRTPEQLGGMAEAPNRFNVLSDATDAAAADSDEFDAIEYSDAGHTAKRQRLEGETERHPAPKWSNPDPYTALPPPDETRAKRKDVVKLIQNAKVAAADNVANENAIADNADFVAFGFGEGDDDSSPEDYSPPEPDVVELTTLNIINTVAPPRHPITNLPSSADVNDLHVSSGFRLQMETLALFDSGPHAQLDIEVSEHGQIAGSKRKRNPIAIGSVTPEWTHLGRSRVDPTPWLSQFPAGPSNMGHWLHLEICNFYNYVRPYTYEADLRDDLLQRVARVLETGDFLLKGRVRAFGSFSSGLYLPTADMDLVYVTDNYYETGRSELLPNIKPALRKVQRALVRAGITEFSTSQCIFGAKIPIVKFEDNLTRLHVDISFDNTTGVTAIETFRSWKAEFPAAPFLIAVIKQFLLMRGLNEVFSGGLGGFSICCLVVSLLQNHPSVRSQQLVPEEHLGQLLVEFFDLYGNYLNLQKTGIMMDPPGYFLKPQTKGWAKTWTIIDPNNPENNISRGSDKALDIQRIFADAHQSLVRRMERIQRTPIEQARRMSILTEILGGDYSSYIRQRDHMKHTHSRQIAPYKGR